MYLDNIKERFAELNFVSPAEIKPCTEEEVVALEQQLDLKLPEAYREFLLWMGHGAGRFLRGMDCFYNELLDIQVGAVELLVENNIPHKLPSDAFVFFMDQGYEFNFLRVSEGSDPLVYCYGEGRATSNFEVIYQKFSDFVATEMEASAELKRRYGL